MSVCLIIVFNSPFVTNIPILMDLYYGRFDTLFFLIHETKDIPNALPIKGETKYFHNFLLQNFEQLRGYDYYVITHDDAILHPHLNKCSMWDRFSFPPNAICLRNIDIVPRDSPWAWAKQGGYDVVDLDVGAKNLFVRIHEQICERFVQEIVSFGLSKYPDPRSRIAKQPPPMLFGGGANADLMFMPGWAFERLIQNIHRLNIARLFVEILIPMAALLTDAPLYLLNGGRHAPIHRQTRISILLRLAIMMIGDRISYHPIKFGQASSVAKRLFLKIYHYWVDRSRRF